MTFRETSKSTAEVLFDVLDDEGIYTFSCGTMITCRVIYERQVEFVDGEGSSFYSDTVDVLSAEIEASDVGDTIQIGGRVYTVGRIIEDDGIARKLAVQ